MRRLHERRRLRAQAGVRLCLRWHRWQHHQWKRNDRRRKWLLLWAGPLRSERPRRHDGRHRLHLPPRLRTRLRRRRQNLHQWVRGELRPRSREARRRVRRGLQSVVQLPAAHQVRPSAIRPRRMRFRRYLRHADRLPDARHAGLRWKLELHQRQVRVRLRDLKRTQQPLDACRNELRPLELWQMAAVGNDLDLSVVQMRAKVVDAASRKKLVGRAPQHEHGTTNRRENTRRQRAIRGNQRGENRLHRGHRGLASHVAREEQRWQRTMMVEPPNALHRRT